MRYSVNVPNFGEFSDPRVVADLSRTAEEAGWDGLWVWDHLLHERSKQREIADPWVLLTAAALATERIRLGTMITPVARRRPAKLARELATLDQLTGGRMVLGVGLGTPVDDEYGRFGETTVLRVLAERLDEGLDVLGLLWSGEPVSYQGKHVTLDDVLFKPTPVQRPRIPIWVGGNWPNKPPMRRAARWDGAIPVLTGTESGSAPPPEEVRDLVAFLRTARSDAGRGEEPFDVVIGGTTSPGTAGRDLVAPLADAGVTWWDERIPFDDRLEPIRRRVEQGPPRIEPEPPPARVGEHAGSCYG